jgi:predicted Zn-dependent peptidase
MSICRRLLIVSLLVAACGPVAENQPGPVDFEFVTEHGMTVRMVVNEGSGLFASNVFVGAGSTRETEATAGSSHFLEHLLFNGTSTLTQEELYAAVDRIGAYNNATTKREYTHYMMVGPQEELGAALGIQSAMLLDSTLPPDKFEKERGIVLEEMNRDADRPDAVRAERLHGLLEHDEPDFLRAVLGTPQTIAALQRDQVLAYYRSQYVPSNMKLLLMGDFDPDQARALIEELFAAPTDQVARPAPRAAWPEASTWSVDGTEDELITVAVQIPAPGVGHPDFAAMDLISDALGGGESARIPAAFERRDAVQIQDSGVALQHHEGRSFLEVRLEASTDQDPAELVAVVLEEFATLARTGLRAVEWTQARNRLLGQSIRQAEQLHYYALMQGDLIWHAEAGFEARYQRALADSYDQIGRVASDWFGAPVIKVAVLSPGSESGRQIFDPAERGFSPRPDAETGSPLPGSGKVETNVPVATGLQPPSVTTLGNGLTIIHSASPGTRMFAMHVLVRDRGAREPEVRPGMADLLHRCLQAGAGPYDSEELASLLDGIGAQLKATDAGFIPYDDYYTLNPTFSFVRLDCVDLYWKEAMRLMGLMLGEPRLEPDEIERARTAMMQRVRQDAQSASARARTAFAEVRYGAEDPRARPVFGREGSLDGVDQKELLSFALDYLDPGQLIISIVGNVDRDAVIEHARATLGFGAASDHVASPDLPRTPTATAVRKTVEIGGPQASIRMGRTIEIEAGDRWPLEVAVMVASDRMQQDLRETRGWAYSLGISANVGDQHAAVTAHMGTRPELAEQAEAAMRDWLDVGRIEVTDDQLAAAVNSHLGRMRMRRVTSIGRAFNLGYDWFTEESLNVDQARSSGMRAVTPADIARVSQKYFVPGPTVTVMAR